MSKNAIKNLGKPRFYGINHITSSNEVTPQFFRQNNENKEPSQDYLAIRHTREAYARQDSQKRHANSKNIWFFSKGLLPPFEEIFWIHKRWKTECPVTCPKKLSLPVPGTLDPGRLQPRVVIVGAGLAGLSTASRLAQAGFKNYQVVEATDRLGGRIHSCWVGDVVAELGAPWLPQASLSNPLYSLAAQEDLLRPPLAWRRMPADAPFLTEQGRELQPRVTRPTVALYRRIREQALAPPSPDQSPSLGDFLRLRFQEALPSVPEEWRQDADRVFWGLANQLKMEYGASENELNRYLLGRQIRLPGDCLRIQLGLLGILGPLLRRIDPKCITTCKPVENINWQCSKARVLLEGGDTLEADYVVVTLPLGVLKERPELFCPKLPEDKATAVERIGWSTVNRFVLCYERPFWLPGEACYRFAWGPQQRAESKSWLKGLSLLEEIPGAPNLLAFSLGGNEAVMTEDCTDESIIEQLTKALRLCSGDSTLPYPKGLVRSRWRCEPHFRGSTSYVGLRTGEGDHCELSRPIPEQRPMLLFAGEATAPGHAATLLGAHLSGVREADRILRLAALPPPPSRH